MGKIFQYLREVKTELAKVVWPSKSDTLKLTVIVIIFSVAVAVFLGAIDLGLIRVFEILF